MGDGVTMKKCVNVRMVIWVPIVVLHSVILNVLTVEFALNQVFVVVLEGFKEDIVRVVSHCSTKINKSHQYFL